MKIGLIGVPTYHGCDNTGTQYGPSKLRNSKIVEIIGKSGVEVIDLGDIHVEEINEADKFKEEKNIKYFNSIYNTNLELARQIDSSLEKDIFPLILGGDHSIAIGSISGASKHSKNLGIVWIDAHGDFNTEISSPSKNSHGMSLGVSCGHGDSRLVNLYYDGIKVKEENIFHIGGRDIDSGEQELIDSSKVNMYDKKVIDKIGFTNVLEDIMKKSKEQSIDGIHISLDIDFIDKYLVEGTGTRVAGGYTVEDTKYILSTLLETGIIKSMDFVEFNPRLDVDNKTLEICKDLISHFSKSYAREEAYTCTY
ncbi:MAG: arginase [Terrisporobacter sp.]|uniref:arginase n=1 Tax=Terrisporobacter sp. TaxID=1965305 RepID=UPI002FC9B364